MLKQYLGASAAIALAVSIVGCASTGSQSLPNIVTNAAARPSGAPTLPRPGDCTQASGRTVQPQDDCGPCEVSNLTVCADTTDFTGGGGGGTGTGGDTTPCVETVHRGSAAAEVASGAPKNGFCTSSGGGGGSGETAAQKIAAAASADNGMNTCSLGPAGLQCVGAVQQVLADAGLSQMLSSSGKIILDVDHFVGQLVVSGYTVTTTPQAGDIVNLGGEHVGICLSAGCASMISNHSYHPPCTFSWVDSPANENSDLGSLSNGTITYYHHN
jgi:hypothetical protein